MGPCSLPTPRNHSPSTYKTLLQVKQSFVRVGSVLGQSLIFALFKFARLLLISSSGSHWSGLLSLSIVDRAFFIGYWGGVLVSFVYLVFCPPSPRPHPGPRICLAVVFVALRRTRPRPAGGTSTVRRRQRGQVAPLDAALLVAARRVPPRQTHT